MGFYLEFLKLLHEQDMNSCKNKQSKISCNNTAITKNVFKTKHKFTNFDLTEHGPHKIINN